jgi:hypothetical protein
VSRSWEVRVVAGRASHSARQRSGCRSPGGKEGGSAVLCKGCKGGQHVAEVWARVVCLHILPCQTKTNHSNTGGTTTEVGWKPMVDRLF